MQLGLIGLGKMGGNMAERLRLRGHQVVGFDFSAEAVAKLTAAGSVGVATLEDMAKKLDRKRFPVCGCGHLGRRLGSERGL